MMNPDHPRWEEFLERLGGAEGCNFQDDGSFTCGGDLALSEAILKQMGFRPREVEASCSYLEEHVACDCEVLLNLTAGTD